MKAALALTLLLASAAQAAESNTPYIDEVRKELKDEGSLPSKSGEPDPYLQSEKKRLGQTPQGDGSYIEELKKDDPETFKKGQQPSYSAGEKARLGPGQNGSAIEDLKAGRSDLQAKFRGNVRNTFGFRLGVASSRGIEGDAEVSNNNFKALYDGHWSPEASFFYLHDLFHHETAGSLGLIGSIGGSYYNGVGKFAFQLRNNAANENFDIDSETAFSFVTLPFELGLFYKMELFKYVKPIAAASLMLVPFFESRTDGRDSYHGLSRGFVGQAGVQLSLDWISKRALWDLYSSYGIQHYYLTVSFVHMQSLASPVTFSISSGTAGLSFEY